MLVVLGLLGCVKFRIIPALLPSSMGWDAGDLSWMTDRQENVLGRPRSQSCYFLLWASDSGPNGIPHPGFPITPPFFFCRLGSVFSSFPCNTWPRLPSAPFPIRPPTLQLLPYQVSVAIIGVFFQSTKVFAWGQNCRAALTMLQITSHSSCRQPLCKMLVVPGGTVGAPTVCKLVQILQLQQNAAAHSCQL